MIEYHIIHDLSTHNVASSRIVSKEKGTLLKRTLDIHLPMCYYILALKECIDIAG